MLHTVSHAALAGCLMRFTGSVVFVSGRVIRVHVRASKLSPGAPEQPVVTNVFSFAFLARSTVKRVVPETMVEAMEYVAGQRQHEADAASIELSTVSAAGRATPPLMSKL